jgi:CO/xanthine dehydrogenase Mo-binding subunit/aerobic-type carbon monoxide dehydrogenase small subunit (CoxS/CutS family)
MSVVDPIAVANQARIRLEVNRQVHQCEHQPFERLVDVLRDGLGLTGTKVGCNSGDCGACTVLVNDQAVCACITPLAAVENARVTTVEGLAEGGVLSRLQQAFLEFGAAQCGACTPGMLMAAEALLRNNPKPQEHQVIDALGGVLCRCTGYRKIIEAVLAAAGGQPLTTPSPRAGQAVGARLSRLDGPDKLTGKTRFAADVAPAGSLWARAVRSPHAHARFELGDLESFRRQYQLAAVITAQDVPNNSFAIFDQPKDQPVLADRLVRFAGEAVLLLVGSDAALKRVDDQVVPIRWQLLPEQPSIESSLEPPFVALHAFAPDNVLCRGRVMRGDVAGALAVAAHTAKGIFSTAYVEHAYIEPEAGYAQWLAAEDGRPERIRIFACTQTPYMDRDEVARVMSMQPAQIHIVPSAVGGGFGGKLDLSLQPLLAVAARKVKGAVRMVYQRGESMRSTTKRHPSQITASFSCDASGRLTALDFLADFNTGAYASWGSTVANRVPVHATGPYRVPHVRALTRAVYTHNSIAGAFRGFGVPQAHIATEALIDELARQVAQDPLEFRLSNALVAGDTTPTGQVLEASVGLRQCLVALQAAWQEAKQRSEQFNRSAMATASALRRGVGVASMWYGIGNTVIANPSRMRGTLTRGGRLVLYNGAQEIGQGTATVMPQIFADAVGLPVNLIDQLMGDTDLTLDAGKSSASRQTFVSGNAIMFAGRELRRQLLDLLGLQEPAVLQMVASKDGAVLQGCSGDRNASINLFDFTTDEIVAAEGYFNPPTVPLDANGQGVPYATFGFAAQFAEVEVDIDLGTVRVLHIHAAHDIGRAINPTQVEGQIHGGIAQGLGMALMERYENGRTDNLHDYLIPTAGDVPPITTYLIEDPEPLGPFGAKGVGEPALIATAPAILNAIYAATGVRIRQVPATPDVVRSALLDHGA